MIVFISAEGDDDGLLAELGRAALTGGVDRPGLVLLEEPPLDTHMPALALARQALVDAERVTAPSVSAWARIVVDQLRARLSPGQAWRLHILACYGVRQRGRIGARAWHSAERQGGRERRRAEALATRATVASGAGEHRCALVGAAVRALLKERQRGLLRGLLDDTHPPSDADTLVQLVLSSAEDGWLSVAVAPRPYAARRWISRFVGGEVSVDPDPAAPSRAYAKLVEAQLRLGRSITPGESCVDLGASPGGWSYVALQHGATVTAVDRSPLRDDLMQNPALTFVKGDAFTYRPPRPVDWMLCDVIAAAERSIQGLLDWLRRGDMCWFVVTIKLMGPSDRAKLDVLTAELPALADGWSLTHLSANKGEVCVYGHRRVQAPHAPP